VKVLAWQDEDGRRWLTYNDAEWLAMRHGLGEGSRAAVTAIAEGLATGVRRAAGG
jgi:hypothetical protein